MNKILLFMLLVLAIILGACSKDDDESINSTNLEDRIIAITTDTRIDFAVISPKENDIVVIDWGDNEIEEFKTIKRENIQNGHTYYSITANHTYNNKPHTIIIKGSIKGLLCSGNQLLSLDVSECTALEKLNCEYNQLTSLDVSKCTVLTELYCHQNQLTSLDVSKCTTLEGLYCSFNQLTSLDISKCAMLRGVYCNDNQFEESAMNKIYTDLPQVKTIDDNQSTIWVFRNPSIGNPSIAENKGWKVTDQ